MNKIVIFVDSCASLTTEIKEKHTVRVIPIFVTMEDKELNPENLPFEIEEYYNKLEAGVVAKSACINPSVFEEFFEEELKNGNDVVYIGMSSGLSATLNNAVMAKNALNEKYPNRVAVIDSRKGGMALAFDVLAAVKMAEEGKNVNEICDALDKNKQNIECVFIPGSIKYLQRSGRITPLKAMLAKTLNINPLITADENGKLEIASLNIGRRKALMAIVNCAKAHLSETNKKIYLCHTNNKEEALSAINLLKNNIEGVEIEISPIDAALGCHCGPRTLALFYFRK